MCPSVLLAYPKVFKSTRILPYIFYRCISGYPKPLTEITYTDQAGYVHYMRRTEEDRDIVPYSPVLSEMFQCHINVDIAYSVLLIMYLYKYFYKGNFSQYNFKQLERYRQLAKFE